MYRHIINSDSGGVMPLTFDKKTQTLSLVKNLLFIFLDLSIVLYM